MKKKVTDVICGIIMVSLIVLLFYSWLSETPKGHYEQTNIIQPDGTHYIWIEEWMDMKGYYTSNVYMGFIPSIGKYWQFESETAYINYMREVGEIWWIIMISTQ